MEHFLFLRLMFWAAMLVFILLMALIIEVAKMLSSWVKALKRKRDERQAEKVVIARPSVGSLDQLAA